MTDNRTLRQRLMDKVEIRQSGCWQWMGCITEWGYGHISVDGKIRRVHRVAYELFVGPIPEGLTIDHLCRNRACANPAHLEPVTMRENLLRGDGPTARNARKTHCVRGHELSGGNLRTAPDGGRYCRACQRLHSQNHRMRKAEANA